MKTNEQKYKAIWDRALALDAKGKTETFSELAKWLNNKGFRNNLGKPYENPRGVARVVRFAWDYAESEFGYKKALPIANSFTKATGDYAWSE
jgi:hypothetical protein